ADRPGVRGPGQPVRRPLRRVRPAAGGAALPAGLRPPDPRVDRPRRVRGGGQPHRAPPVRRDLPGGAPGPGGADDESGCACRARGAMAGVTAKAARSGLWARYLGVSLVHSNAERIAAQPALVRALTDGVERSAEPEMPDAEGEWFEVRERGEV